MRWPVRLLALLLALSSSGAFNSSAGCDDEEGDCGACTEHCQCACCPLPARLAPASVQPQLLAPAAERIRVEPDALVTAAVTADIFHPPRA